VTPSRSPNGSSSCAPRRRLGLRRRTERQADRWSRSCQHTSRKGTEGGEQGEQAAMDRTGCDRSDRRRRLGVLIRSWHGAARAAICGLAAPSSTRAQLACRLLPPIVKQVPPSSSTSLPRADADRAALIGRLHQRQDAAWLAEIPVDLEEDEPARLATRGVPIGRSAQ
jgi:hypothetical protein